MPPGETHIPREATLVVAASDSLTPSADYVCDGTDDQVEINAAIDALPAGGGTVLLLEGTFTFSSTLNITGSNITIRGSGRATELKAGADVVYIFKLADVAHITIRDMFLNGDGRTGTTGVYMTVGQTSSNITLSYLIFEGFDTTSGVIYRTTNALVEHCLFTNNTGNHFRFTFCDNVICTGNRFLVGTGTSVSLAICTCSNTVVSDNIIEGGTGDLTKDGALWIGCAYADVHDIIIANNVIRHITNKDGISFIGDYTHNHNLDNLEIVGNVIEDINRDGIGNRRMPSETNQGNWSKINIHDNIITDCKYGINFDSPGTGAINNLSIKDNQLVNCTSGPIGALNSGIDYRFDAYVVPFSDGSEPQDSGFLIDVDTEMARTWLRLPPEVQQVVRMRIYARAAALSATTMALEINVNGGADNEPFNTHATAAPNTPSTSSDFAANDVVFWTLTSAEIVALLGGDSVEVKVLHEAADAGGGVATDAYLRTVEFEYV